MTDATGLPECITLNSVTTAPETDGMRKQVCCADAMGVSQILIVFPVLNVGKVIRNPCVMANVNQCSRRKY